MLAWNNDGISVKSQNYHHYYCWTQINQFAMFCISYKPTNIIIVIQSFWNYSCSFIYRNISCEVLLNVRSKLQLIEIKVFRTLFCLSDQRLIITIHSDFLMEHKGFLVKHFTSCAILIALFISIDFLNRKINSMV